MAYTEHARNKENAKSLDFMINHVFLPPRLPQEDDTDPEDLFATVQTLCESVSRFRTLEPTSRTSVQPALEMLKQFLKTYPHPDLDAANKRQALYDTITNLKHGAQNAGLLLTAQQDGILFEAFELLAPNHNVMTCEGALLREFPDRAALVALDKIQDEDFLVVLVDFIQKLEADVAPTARPKVSKGGTEQPEERDTVSPILAIGLLIDMLSGLGQGVEPERITKRSREHVSWDNAFLPFHRLPAWLLLRVALRVVLDRRAGLAGEESWYKPLMAYHHARILKIAAAATDPPIPSDKLFSMQAKLARRITKLSPTEEAHWLDEVKETVVSSDTILQERWERAQNEDAKVLPLNEIQALSFHQDSELKIPTLRAHLSWIKSRSTIDSDPMGPGDTTHFTSLRSSGRPALSSDVPEDVIMDPAQLVDFEAWVASELWGWTRRQLGFCTLNADPNYAVSAVGTLRDLIDAYFERARAAYDGIPEGLSVMYLVIMELWVAMDAVAGDAIPLLLDYDPGFPLDAFCPLLLEGKEEMARLRHLEAYLSGRQNRAPKPYSSAFEGFGREDSFAVRFFKTSAKHQRLRDEIESWGRTMEAEKLQEYDTMRAEYDGLARSYSAANCKTYWDHRWGLVVEISMPQLVQIWRDTTWKLVTVVFQKDGRRRLGGEEYLYFAGNHCGLPRFSLSGSRLRPASTVKPMEVSHYGTKHISKATTADVCVPHAARYEYYDEHLRLLAIDEIRDVGIPPHCSYAELVKGTPAVEDWIRHAEHTSNDVIASQYRCPLDTTLEEFRAFGNLRAGFTLQWANILSQLVMPSLDFNKKPTFALVIQACLEAGPGNRSLKEAGTIWREAHVDTQNESFINNMLRALHDALERVKESWQNDIALCLLSCLATRLLTLSPSPEVSNALLGYLAQVRTTSIEWARVLLGKLNHSNIDLERQEWAQRLLMAALISAVTFNLVRRWHLVMYQARHIATKEIVHKGNGGLDTAIRQFWAAYSPPSAEWTLPGLESRNHILERNGGLSVSFNLLTGNLFVNGYPLSKLPLDYQRHSTFRQLFGEQILDVGPSSIPGMQFSACREQDGWLVHFAMKDDQLVVRAVWSTDQSGAAAPDSDQTWEYIPRDHLEGDLPSSFVNNYAHWLNLLTDEIEFRPLDNRWQTSSENWRLVRSSGSNVSRLKRGSRFVIDSSSPTAELAHKILGCIESFWHIDTIFDRGDNVLLFELPRLCLSFSVGEGEAVVKSKNYTGMQIDQSQGIGTLVGLLNKLVLKPDSGSGFRIILVPRGEVSARHVKSLDHVDVSIYRDNDSHVRHDSFVVNDKLGCLSDTGSLQSKLYLCWLHALTSHPLPDPLTRRTGTEEALRILRSAAVKSHLTIDHGSREFLVQIAKLSPSRRYYPTHIHVMEQTKWNYHIPPLSQHEDFWGLAKDTYDHYERLAKLFQLHAGIEDTSSAADAFAKSEQRRSPTLAERASIRNAIFRTSEFGAESHTTAKDEWYRPDDRRNPGSADDRAKVAKLTRCVDTGCGRLLFSRSEDLPDSVIRVNGDEFSGCGTVDLAFNLDYLNPPSESLKGRWCGLHRGLAAERNKYRKILFLSSLLYAERSEPEIVQALMAFGTIPVFSQAEMLPPSETEFDLTVRRHNLSKLLTSIVEDGAKTFGECPEANWPSEQWKIPDDFGTRQYRKWKSKSNGMIESFVADLESQVQSWAVDTPTDSCYSTYLDVDSIMPKHKTVIETQPELHLRYIAFLATSTVF
ncbi:hypothetical protein NEMBOFW57_004076 [Staphylotrichum longicolle]|uniref:DUF6606 domain-containing protein n=1 Tax=Staphylotrichum longicolle TaxID=669026 RepID=A0AAD4I5A0_9PEZI|nr:hypothetical protein NEMBOFW57_004076 [Staphylotrichum longicolle]